MVYHQRPGQVLRNERWIFHKQHPRIEKVRPSFSNYGDEYKVYYIPSNEQRE